MERGVAQVNKILKKAKSLCAVFLACALIFFAVPICAAETTGVVAEKDASTYDPFDEYREYVYSIEIEFGSFNFYYDYGIWDVANLRYSASASSTYPAAETVEGAAGWYNFDGVSNKISVKNISRNGDVDVTVRFDTFKENELNDSRAYLDPSSVTMTFYGSCTQTDGFGNKFDSANSEYTATIGVSDTPTDIYISFSGKPQEYIKDDSGIWTSAATAYDALQYKEIGYITLTVSLPSTEEQS